MRASSHLKRLKTLQKKLYPPPKQSAWLPAGVHLYQDEKGCHYYLPGAKECWERSQKIGINPNLYINLLPDEDGCCMCDRPGENCSCVKKLWDAIDIPSLERVPQELELSLQEYYGKMGSKAV